MLAATLIPAGCMARVVKSRELPWASAHEGQAVNQVMSEVSPQPQVTAVEGWPPQTPHHSATARPR